MKQYQLIVIGSGPGGYVAAIRAGILGLKTAIVEKDPFLGGTCLHRGCIPTKALLHSAEILDQITHAAAYGIETGKVRLDAARVFERKAEIVDKLAGGIRYLMKKRKVDVYNGTGRFTAERTITVSGPEGDESLGGDKVIIATGSTPADLPHIQSDGRTILNSDHILQPADVPARLVVIGSGAVGSEFASIFRSFGSTVHLVEVLPRLLPIEDEECSKQLERSFKSRKIKCYTGARVTAVDVNADGAKVSLTRSEKETTIDVDKVLLAVGRKPVIEALDPGAGGVETDGRFVKVDEYMRTSAAGVYAIGDVVATPQLAHVASAEGILAVDHMAGKPARPIDYRKIPSCTYSSPEVASVGLTEAAARDEGYDVAIGKFPFSGIGKAMILGEPAGFVKIIADKRYDEVLGVHIVGPRATELIAEACLGMKIETTVEEIARTVHAHPTLSEAMLEAAHSVYGEAIHN